MPGNQRQAASSSGSENSSLEERKRKRMISNRESARRSRMRKQKQLEDLLNEVTNLQSQNAQLRQSIDLAEQRYVQMESANNVLRAQATELTDRLRSLNEFLQIVEEVGGFDVEIPESIIEPWQHPCPFDVASAVDMFQC